MTAAQAIELLNQRRELLRRRFHVRDLAIFGSVARNEARPESDLDVLVEFEGAPTFDGYMGLKLYLEELFGMRVDLGTRADLRPELRSRIAAEAVYVS
jgi:predicted nucleotidyltransferase